MECLAQAPDSALAMRRLGKVIGIRAFTVVAVLKASGAGRIRSVSVGALPQHPEAAYPFPC